MTRSCRSLKVSVVSKYLHILQCLKNKCAFFAAQDDIFTIELDGLNMAILEQAAGRTERPRGRHRGAAATA